MSIIEIDDSEDRKDRLLRLAKAVRRKHILEQQRIQSDLGEQGRPGGLIPFVRNFWHILEPATPFVEGWVVEAVAMHLEAVTRGEIKRLVINVPPGFMKPVHVDELVATGRGFVRLGDVVVGDKVLTHKGRYRAVTAVHEQGVIPVVRIKTLAGRSIVAAPDHPFLTPRGWVNAGDLTPSDDLAAPRENAEPNLHADQVVAVEPHGSGECRCLTVEEDSTFTVNGVIVHNSLLVNVYWPAWEWSAAGLPSTRYVTFSYAAHLTIRDNAKFRDLIRHVDFQEVWGHLVTLKKEGEIKPENENTGWKFASSVGGVGTGERGNRLLADDLHSVKSAESEAVRQETVRWVKEGMSNRLNDMANDVIIGIAQRVHEEDASAAMLADPDYVHLCVPMQFDPGRKCRTKIGWEDPRTKEGELAWPERFPLAVVNKLKTTLGPYAFSAQYQQAPSPRGGGIIKSEWWQVWDEPTYPQCYYRWASADTAYTEKEENDPTGFTCWGLFEIAGQPQIIMMDAWRKRLELHIPARWTDERSPEHRLKLVQAWRKAAWAQKERAERDGTHVVDPVIGPEVEPWASFVMHGVNTADRWPGETYEDWKLRTQDHWGLCEWLVHSCRRFSVNELIIEGKASGISVAQELRRLNGNEGWGVKLVTPEGDKVARAYAVQSIFSAGLVHAPQRAWAEMVIEEVSGFPKGRYKDLTDSTTMALKHIREIGLLVRPEERLLHDEMAARYVPQSKPLYPT